MAMQLKLLMAEQDVQKDHALTKQKLPSSLLVVNNTAANKSTVLKEETPLVLLVGMSQLSVAESQTMLLLVRAWM